MLLNYPGIDANRQSSKGLTALRMALRKSKTTSTEGTVQMLLNHPGIDVNAQDKHGNNVIHYICSRPNDTVRTVKMLLDHPKINKPIEYLIENNKLEYIKLMDEDNITPESYGKYAFIIEHSNKRVHKYYRGMIMRNDKFSDISILTPPNLSNAR
jgi:ankyrin repeat protein